ncbi:MAG TPA: hypothetical protein VE619_02180, partial [Nitrososphaeraceae archaeon]|nr:hypothetical protein [Nitrososphaeraceae archaeon]
SMVFECTNIICVFWINSSAAACCCNNSNLDVGKTNEIEIKVSKQINDKDLNIATTPIFTH